MHERDREGEKGGKGEINFQPCPNLYYLLGKGGYVFGSIGLYVCIFVCQ